MRTTIDVPDHLYREAKTRAVMQGTTLKELVIRWIQAGLLAGSGTEQPVAKPRVDPPVAIRRIPGKSPHLPLSKRQLSELLEEEELQSGDLTKRFTNRDR